MARAVRRRRRRRGPDRTVAPSQLEFHFTQTFQCGDEEANVGHIVIVASGYRVVAEGVFTYRAAASAKEV